MQPQTEPLPHDVKRLIARKLSKLKSDLDARLAQLKAEAFATVAKETGPALREGNFGYAMTALPLSAYRAQIANTRIEIADWPLRVWIATEAVVELARIDALIGRNELVGLLEDFTWSAQTPRFVLQHLDATRFLDTVRRKFGRYGLNNPLMLERLEHSILHQETLAKISINNLARRARKTAEIAIDEYLLGRKARFNATQDSMALIGSRSDASQTHLQGTPERSREIARHAANVRHGAPGGSRDKRQQVREMWRTGKFKTKTECAAKATREIGISHATAVKELREPRKKST
jgi:hypothetical protein